MKTLISPSDTINQVWGEMKEDPKKEYKLSVFCLRSEISEKTYLFHTLTCELLQLDEGEEIDSCRSFLISHRFLVPVMMDEHRFVDDTRAILSKLSSKKYINDFTILTTTDCNARCFYCYEKGRKRIPMSEETALDVASYMLRVSGDEKIRITWFGGEPLYNISAIRLICKKLKDKGKSFSSRIITNGLYLKEDIVKEAVSDWNTERAQITLDGTRDAYRRIKAYIDQVEDPFETVLNNIECCIASGIRVSIRLNMTADNADDIIQLCKELSDRFLGNRKMSIYTAFVRDFRNRCDKSDWDEEVVLDEKIRIAEEILEKAGMSATPSLKKTFRINRCMADSDSSEVILPDGNIGKCEHFSETEIIGNIYQEEKDTKLVNAWKQKERPLELCCNCPLYPQCIRLKKCDWTAFGCTTEERNRKIRRIEKSIASFLSDQAKLDV